MNNILQDVRSTTIDALKNRYGLTEVKLERLPLGQGAINYKVTSSSGIFFAKRYTEKTDLIQEEAAIEISEVARLSGVPGATPIKSISGRFIDNNVLAPISLWHWADGVVLADSLTLQQYSAVGATLGEIHRIFATLPQSKFPPIKSDNWKKASAPTINITIEHILEKISFRYKEGIQDKFDAEAIHTLKERQFQLLSLHQLLEDLPVLGSQVLHGDYTFVNLLFKGSNIAAVLDFRPPAPFLTAYDLGRIAFHPRTVAVEENWLQIAERIISEYKRYNKNIAAQDIIFSGRVALIQLLKSLYGIKEHYFQKGLIQDDLDKFWRLRHKAVKRMLLDIKTIDDMLSSI
jgi:homoserine kinase type II